jgi:integrase
MSNLLAQVLQEYRIECKKKGLSLGLGEEPEFVFTDTKGGFIDVNNWRRRMFNKALEKAKLRKIRIHDLRHTYATLRVSKNDNIDDVSKQLGHFSTKFTLDAAITGCRERKNQRWTRLMIRNIGTQKRL